MLNLKIKEPDYKALYESRQAKIDSLNKTIVGLKGRITRLENELNKTKPKHKCNCETHSFYTWEMDENKCSDCNGKIY